MECPPPLSDAYWLAPGAGALINRRALSERSKLVLNNLCFIVSAVSPGLVVWPSSAADTGEKARIV